MATRRAGFSYETALGVVKKSEDAWNRRVPSAIPQDYSENTIWRYRDQFFVGREHIVPFLEEHWPKQQNYKLKKELWSFTDRRISVRFESEWKNAESGQWYRTHGNEHWEFDDEGKVAVLDLSANDVKISEGDRRLF